MYFFIVSGVALLLSIRIISLSVHRKARLSSGQQKDQSQHIMLAEKSSVLLCKNAEKTLKLWMIFDSGIFTKERHFGNRPKKEPTVKSLFDIVNLDTLWILCHIFLVNYKSCVISLYVKNYLTTIVSVIHHLLGFQLSLLITQHEQKVLKKEIN